MIKFTGDKKTLINLNYSFNLETRYWEKELKHKATGIKIRCCISDDNVIDFIGDQKYSKVFLQELGSDNYVFV